MAPRDELNAELTGTQLNPETVRVGATIKAFRQARRMKGIALAHAVGISHSYLSNVEAGRKRPTRALCSRIAAELQVPVVAIVDDTYRTYSDAEAGEP